MIAGEKEINNYFIAIPNLEKALDRENVYATNIIDPFKKKRIDSVEQIHLNLPSLIHVQG